jgi:CheY-like chemotaxis protein
MYHDRILLVEDEPLIAMMLEQMVQDLGYHVEGTAGSEQQAFDLLRSTEPDLVVLDVQLGLTTSLGIAALCRERGIAIVYTTGHEPGEFQRDMGAATVLSKPYTSKDLQAALELASSQLTAPGSA